MDAVERRVLKRKRMTIAKYLPLTQEYVEEFRNCNLLTDHRQEVVMAEATNFQRVIKLMELIPQLNDDQTIHKLCTILEREYDWLADEIRVELVAERGQLKIDDYINKESTQLVFREFGQSKRLSEREKKEIQNLVALRTQYAKEVWRRRLDIVREELRLLREENARKDAMTVDLTTDARGYVRVHASRLRYTHALENQAERKRPVTSQGGKPGEEEEEEEEKTKLLEQLHAAIQALENMASRSLQEKDDLASERFAALKILDVTDKNAKLDVALDKVIQESLRRLTERQQEADANAARADKLRAELEALKEQNKRELLEKDETMEQLAAHLNTAHQRVRDMLAEIERLRHELQAVRRECERYRERAERLERARRLGYIQDRSMVLPQLNGGAAPISAVAKGNNASDTSGFGSASVSASGSGRPSRPASKTTYGAAGKGKNAKKITVTYSPRPASRGTPRLPSARSKKRMTHAQST